MGTTTSIEVIAKGAFTKTKEFLERMQNEMLIDGILNRYAQMGVEALSAATPIQTGETASSWGYELQRYPGAVVIYWTNSHVEKGVPIALILQYGHGTGTGGYVEGIDYINPALKSTFESMIDAIWEEVKNS